MQEKITTKNELTFLFTIYLYMSLDEFGGIDYNIDATSHTSEWSEKMSDAMKEAVVEQAKQWKLIAGKIKNNKAQNNAYARFLAFLLTQINSEQLLSMIYKLFFTTKDPYHGTVYIRKSSNYPVLIGMFVPFFRDKIIEFKMQSLYSSIYDPTTQINLQNYLSYLKKLAYTMHDNVALDQELLLQCIVLIANEFHLIDSRSLDSIQLQEIHALIKKELY